MAESGPGCDALAGLTAQVAKASLNSAAPPTIGIAPTVVTAPEPVVALEATQERY